jgi:hypothetical protein
VTDIMQDPFAAENADAMALFSPRSIGAVFPRDGFTIEGDGTDWRMEQSTHKDSGELLFWHNRKKTEDTKVPAYVKANPKSRVMQMVISLQGEPTGETWETIHYIRKEIPGDDGMRSLYVTGDRIRALAKALEPHGLQIPERSGFHLSMTRTRAVKQGDFIKYLYSAVYTPAAQNPNAAAHLLKAQGEAPEGSPFDEESPF